MEKHERVCESKRRAAKSWMVEMTAAAAAKAAAVAVAAAVAFKIAITLSLLRCFIGLMLLWFVV